MSGSYWNEEIETMSAKAVERLESEGLQTQMAYVYATSAYFRAQFDQVGTNPESIKHRNDLVDLPFMEKHEIADSQSEGQLLGINQCASQEDIIRVQATGGTTGRPMRVGWTRQDIADYCEVGSRALWANGCRPSDLVFECMNYNLYAGGLSDHLCFETLGAATIPYGVGNSLRLLEMMSEIQQDLCIWATPSYAIRLAALARENGFEPRDIGLRKGFFSGEPGMQVAGYREKIEDSWGLESFDMYGTGELGMHSGECMHRNNLHYAGTGVVLTELIDPETAQPIPFDEGVIGEFVYTSLRREACPHLRMRSRDLMQVFVEPCPCGRTGFRFKILGRSDDMFIVKGVNVFPLAVQATITRMRPKLSGEFQIILDRPPPIDYAPRIIVEVARDLPQEQYADLISETIATIANELNFSATVELTEEGSISTEKKSRRLIRDY
ncbi:MAG: phenylacetate--CoA ligase [Gammaproteobacteria bacterium]|nr:phenylacetate--CoA ligase [Gammaproteobacteria bacterium]